MTTISITVHLSPQDIRLLDLLKKSLSETNTEVISRAIRQLAFNVGVEKTILDEEHNV